MNYLWNNRILTPKQLILSTFQAETQLKNTAIKFSVFRVRPKCLMDSKSAFIESFLETIIDSSNLTFSEILMERLSKSRSDVIVNIRNIRLSK